jgi:hypothetical protein
VLINGLIVNGYNTPFAIIKNMYILQIMKSNLIIVHIVSCRIPKHIPHQYLNTKQSKCVKCFIWQCQIIFSLCSYIFDLNISNLQ